MLAVGILLIACSSMAFSADSYYEKYNGWKYTVINQVKLVNDSAYPTRNIKVTVPLMDTAMPLYQDFLGEQLDPWPAKIITDANGHRQAVYNIPYLGAYQEKIIEQRYLVMNYSVKYNFEITKIADTYTENIDPVYLSSAPGIESDNPEIVAYAKQIAGAETNPYLIARKAFADINLYLTYKDGENANKGALNALHSGEGVCEDYTDLFIAVMRASGIPARKQIGYLHLPFQYNTEPYFNNTSGLFDLDIMTHSWPEFYLPGLGWVVADPTFTYEADISGEVRKFVDWSYFSNIPSGRNYIFTVGGDNVDQSVQYSSQGGSLKVSYDAMMYVGEKYQPYNDIDGHWAEESIVYLKDRGLISGVGNGLFGVSESVTRAQIAVLLQRIFRGEAGSLNFRDVPRDYWAAAEIAAAQKAGWLIGFPDGTYRPDKALTRAEIAAILVRAFKLEATSNMITFRDLGQYGWVWADQPIRTIANLGIAGGTGDGHFLPQKTATRAELAVFLAKTLKYLP